MLPREVAALIARRRPSPLRPVPRPLAAHTRSERLSSCAPYWSRAR